MLDYSSDFWQDALVFRRLDRVARTAIGQSDLFDLVELSADLRFLFDQTADYPIELASKRLNPFIPIYVVIPLIAGESQSGEQGATSNRSETLRATLGLELFINGVTYSTWQLVQNGSEFIFSAGVVRELDALWFKRRHDNFTLLPAREYLSSTIGTINQNHVTVSDIIRYFANKAGGVHIDPGRNHKKDKVYRLLDKLNEHLRIRSKLGWSPLEQPLQSLGTAALLVAISQHLFRSTSVRRLYNGLREKLVGTGMLNRKSPWEEVGANELMGVKDAN